MLSQRKYENINFIKKTNFIRKKTSIYSDLSPYNIMKISTSLIILGLLIIFFFSLWYYLMPRENKYEKSIGYENKLGPLNSKNMHKKIKRIDKNPTFQKRDPIVKIMRTKATDIKASKKDGIDIYNQAVLNDRTGNYKTAIKFYQKALMHKHPKILHNAKAIRQRLNYLIHRKVTP